MELRHLRHFIAVAEASSFTEASARLRIAQPALSRQVQSLEEEIGVDLLRRGPRGVTLTAEGRLLLAEARILVSGAKEAVEKVRALARGEFGELNIGYAPSPTVELLPPALAAFQETTPRVKVVLHELSSNEIAARLREGGIDLGLLVRPTEENAVGLKFETLRSYPFQVAVHAKHPLARLRSVPVARVAREPIVTLHHGTYTDFHRLVLGVFSAVGTRPRIVAECDSGVSLFAEVESGRGVALLPSVYRHAVGRRLKLRPLTPLSLPVLEVVVAHRAKGDLTPAAAKFLSQLLETAPSCRAPDRPK
jgi:DNA-binding transcriptional LysR family regulator